MSNLSTLARPYAKAAFDLASGQGDLPGWNGALANAAAVVSDETLAGWLQSPGLDRKKAVQFVADATGSDNDHFQRFLGVLAANDRLSLLPEVTEMFGQLREAAENRLQVKVVSAVALESDQAERMSTALARRFDCEIELQNEVDARVLGGAVIYAGDQVIDGSLLGRLSNLENSLA
jgi:F-type H+-transporting ATPase subunit delta